MAGFPYEYLVGGVIAVAGTAFAFFNAYMAAADDRALEHEEHERRATPQQPSMAEAASKAA